MAGGMTGTEDQSVSFSYFHECINQQSCEQLCCIHLQFFLLVVYAMLLKMLEIRESM